MPIVIQLPNSSELRNIGTIAIQTESVELDVDEYYYQVAQVLISGDRLQYLQEAWDSRHQITVDSSGNVTGVTGTLEDVVIPKEALTIPDASTYDSSPFYPYRESAKSLTLPSNLGLIGNYAFRDCSGFTGNLTLPNSIISIGGDAFYNCSGFTGSLTIPNSVTSIGFAAFQNCSGFTGSLTIPNNLTSIGSNEFKNCSGFMGSLTIPNSVISIGYSAFEGCGGFINVVFDGQAPTLRFRAFLDCTAILEYDFTNCTTVPALENTNAFTGINANCRIKIPLALEAEWKAATNWVTYADYIVGVEPDEYYYYYQVAQVLISADRLQYLQEAWDSRHQITVDSSGNVTGVTGTLEDIVIPIEALTIPDSASGNSSPFYPYRESAKSLTLPSNLGLIGNYAFYLCGELTGSLIIPNSVTSIGSSAFYGCSGFTGELTISNSVISIGQQAFEDCSGFTGNLTIPNSVTSISNYAFHGCSGFTGSLTLPNSVTSISNYAFRGCSGFTGSLTIPNSVTSIGNYAFRDCSGFTSVVFEGQALTLSAGAFYGCTAILEYDFTNCTTIPSLSAITAFTGINANCQIKVPLSLADEWKAATNWATYADYIVGV